MTTTMGQWPVDRFCNVQRNKVVCFGQRQQQWQERAPKPQEVGPIEGFFFAGNNVMHLKTKEIWQTTNRKQKQKANNEEKE